MDSESAVVAESATGARRSPPQKFNANADTLWLFASDAANDAVHASDTERDLIARFGAANVTRDTIFFAEGENSYGTVLFPKDPLRRLEVRWDDDRNFVAPERATIGGQRSRWFVHPGVSVGMCADTIETINGRPFELYGFNWDYGGTVYSWKNGRLDSLWNAGIGAREPKRLIVRFGQTQQSDSAVGISGERVLSSMYPGMIAARPCVHEIILRPR